MKILPAVDILEGRCVNLVQGEFADETVFSDDPVAQAVTWHKEGGELVHIVDLDGAKAGHCCIEDQLREMSQEGVPFEVGGGIRNLETIFKLVEVGAQRIIIGTAALRDPKFLRDAMAAFASRIVVGVDAKDGKVAVNAWTDVTEQDAVKFAKHMQDEGVSRIAYTDILSDGMMRGPNIDATKRFADELNIPVTASGGVSSLDDIRALSALESQGVDEVIVGRALYVNAFTLKEAIEASKG